MAIEASTLADLQALWTSLGLQPAKGPHVSVWEEWLGNFSLEVVKASLRALAQSPVYKAKTANGRAAKLHEYRSYFVGIMCNKADQARGTKLRALAKQGIPIVTAIDVDELD